MVQMSLAERSQTIPHQVAMTRSIQRAKFFFYSTYVLQSSDCPGSKAKKSL